MPDACCVSLSSEQKLVLSHGEHFNSCGLLRTACIFEGIVWKVWENCSSMNRFFIQIKDRHIFDSFTQVKTHTEVLGILFFSQHKL